VRIKLAPMSRLIPQEMAKNGTAAEKSRMVVGGLKAYYSIGRGSQAITRLAGPKEKGAREGASYRSPLQFDKEQWGKQVYMLIR
jgi:hypothetical protein